MFYIDGENLSIVYFYNKFLKKQPSSKYTIWFLRRYEFGFDTHKRQELFEDVPKKQVFLFETIEEVKLCSERRREYIRTIRRYNISTSIEDTYPELLSGGSLVLIVCIPTNWPTHRLVSEWLQVIDDKLIHGSTTFYEVDRDSHQTTYIPDEEKFHLCEIGSIDDYYETLKTIEDLYEKSNGLTEFS